MMSNKISLDEAVKVAEERYPDKSRGFEVIGFVGALMGIDSSSYFKLDQHADYIAGHKKGEEWLTVNSNSDKLC
jgi:hypothetical protein